MKKLTLLLMVFCLISPNFVFAQYKTQTEKNYKGGGSGDTIQPNLFGFGTVPVIDANAIIEAVKTYKQLRDQYKKVKAKYDLAIKMAGYIKNMPNRYKTLTSRFNNVKNADEMFFTMDKFIDTVNGDVSYGDDYSKQAEEAFNEVRMKLDKDFVATIPTDDEERYEKAKKQQMNIVISELAIKRSLANLTNIANQQKENMEKLKNLESDSLSSDEGLNSQVAVLNKINASNILLMKQIQDTNKLLASLSEQQNAMLKQQNDLIIESINTDVAVKKKIEEGEAIKPLSNINDSLKKLAEVW